MDENSKIRLQECYPYTYVRVTTMRAKLLGRDDYNKLLKMGFAEIAKYLQDSEYTKDINELATGLEGAELLEAALNKNLITSFEKLWRISPDELDLLINAYVKRYDFFNIKTIIRGRFSKLSKDEIKVMLKPIGLYNDKFYRRILDEQDIEKILVLSELINKKEMTKLIKEFRETNSLLMIENALDKAYFNFVFEFCDRIPSQGKLFKEFLLHEIDALNIRLLLRLKKDGMDEKQIINHLYMNGFELDQTTLQRLIKLNYESLLKALSKTSFKQIIKKNLKSLQSKESLIDLENDLNKHLLKKSLLLLHQNPLSIDIILGYMFAKDIEVTNLKKIIKAKQLGMDEEFITKQLVVN